jgi:hypothetical protein
MHTCQYHHNSEFSELDKLGTINAFGLFLYAIVLKQMDLKDEARENMAKSCAAFPLNWCAWLELASLCDTYAEVPCTQLALTLVETRGIHLPHHHLTHLLASLDA